MKNELHLREPRYKGDRSDMEVGIAHRRLVNRNGKPKRGFFTVWIDLKQRDTTHPTGYSLVFPYPYRILCSEALKFPVQYLNDYKHTMLHIIPLSKMAKFETRRKRTETQAESAHTSEVAQSIHTSTEQQQQQQQQQQHLNAIETKIVLSYAKDLEKEAKEQQFPLF